MADMGKRFKNVWMKGMEAIGNTASSIATNTKYKVNEMNLVNRRHEILSDFGAKAYEIWQKGEESFPPELEKLLRELTKVDEELNSIRAERIANVKPEPVREEAESEEAENADEAAEDEPADEYGIADEATQDDGEDGTDDEEDGAVPTLPDREPDEREIGASLSEAGDAIDALFEQAEPVVEKASARLDSMLDDLDDTLTSLGKQVEAKIDDVIDDLNK